MSWSSACPDWAARIASGRTLVPPLPLNVAEADRATAVFNELCLPDVVGQPPLAIAAGEWQRDLVKAVFGSYDPEADERHLREFFVLVPKKNSKTTAGAAIMVVALLMNRRPRAEFLLVAPTQEVADLAFRQASGMIEADPTLRLMFKIDDNLKRIMRLSNKAFLKVKSFDPKIVTGSKPSGILLDELHVMAAAPDADRVIGQLRGGMISQPEAFFITITTQSERPPAGVFRAELLKARKVRDGEISAPLLPLLYEFPPQVDWKDPANWWMVTPNRGRSITVDRLVVDHAAAKEAGEEEYRRWCSQHLNVEIGLGLRTDAWVGAEHWSTGLDADLTLDAILARSDAVVVGIDGGGLDDLLGLAVLGRDRVTRCWLLWGRAWAHPSVLARRKQIASALRDFERDGDLVIVDHPGDDVDEVADIVLRIKEAGLLPEKNGVGVDQAGIGAIVDTLAMQGIADGAVVAVPQGWRLTGAIKTVERKLVDGTLRHGGQPLMAWVVGNAKTEPKGNGVAITKAAAGSAKIDPLVAAFNAVALMSMNPEGAMSLDAFLADPVIA